MGSWKTCEEAIKNQITFHFVSEVLWLLNAPMKLFGFVFREVPGRAADGLCHFLADTDSSGARVQSEYEQALGIHMHRKPSLIHRKAHTQQQPA